MSCQWLVGGGQLPREAQHCWGGGLLWYQYGGRTGGCCWARTLEGGSHSFPVLPVSLWLPRSGGPSLTDAGVSDPRIEEWGPGTLRQYGQGACLGPALLGSLFPWTPLPIPSLSAPCAQIPVPSTSWHFARAPSELGLLDLRTPTHHPKLLSPTS